MAAQVNPGITDGVYADMVQRSELQMNLRPPEETTNEVEASLRALLLFEETKARAAETDAAAAKERMLSIEKTKLRDIVDHVFSPLMGRTRQH